MHSIPIKEHQIIDHPIYGILRSSLKHEKMAPSRPIIVKKQTRAGPRERHKSFVVVGDFNGHVGLGVKTAKEKKAAEDGSENLAKLNIVPVRRGYWGNKIGKPHTIPAKVTGKCGSVMMRFIPSPRGTGIVAARNAKKVLQLAGVE